MYILSLVPVIPSELLKYYVTKALFKVWYITSRLNKDKNNKKWVFFLAVIFVMVVFTIVIILIIIIFLLTTLTVKQSNFLARSKLSQMKFSPKKRKTYVVFHIKVICSFKILFMRPKTLDSVYFRVK